MGSLLPVVSGREAVTAFEKFGWHVVRQKASHIILTKPGEIVTLSIPDHREVARGTLRSLIRLANLTIPEFLKALK
jgi:predicted RNA binding protein YcfA (HicA-like mRNA interferase family)